MEANIILKMKADGVKIVTVIDDDGNKTIHSQLQAIEEFENKEGEQDIRLHTLKVRKELSQEEQKDILNKSIETNQEMGLKEHIFDYNKGYSCDDFIILDKNIKEPFLVNNFIKGIIKTATSKTFEDKKTKETKISTSFNIVSKVDNSIKITTIKVNSKIKDYQNLVGKNLLFENLKINIFNMKKYISTDSLPKIV